jgi:hypothetical protein
MLKSQESFGTILNLSGRQRMMSQRLAAISLQSLFAKNETKIVEEQNQIKKLLNELRQAHMQLTQEGKNAVK